MLLEQTQKEIKLPFNVKVADSFFSRFKGLMFKKTPITNEGLLIEPCNSIHMFFMFFPIDVVFLDKQNQVVAVREHLPPWRMIFPIRSAYSTLELPIGTIHKYEIHLGDHLKI